MKTTLSPLAAARAREIELATGLKVLAARHGVQLHGPLQIDSRGEFSIVVDNPRSGFDGPMKTYGTLAAVLNGFRPRCGVLPMDPGYLEASSCWCSMNHFDVERMLKANLDAPAVPGDPAQEAADEEAANR